MKRITPVVAVLVLALLALAVYTGTLSIAKAAGDAPQRVAVSGTPAEMGAAIGEAYGPKIAELHPRFLALAQQRSGRTKDQLYAAAHTIARGIHEDDRAEMRGLAEAAGLDYDDVLFLNCFYSLTDGVACRQLVAWGDRTADGGLIHARNLDWIDYQGNVLQRHHVIVNYDPAGDDTHRYLLFTWPGLTAAITGANDAGLTIGFNQLGRTIADATRITEPTFFTIKRALRTCGSIEEAVTLIREARPRDNGSIMVSDARSRKAVVVELIDGAIGVRDAGERPLIGNANHPTREAGLAGPLGFRDADAPVCTVALALGRPLTAEDAQRVMRHAQVLQRTNLLSVVLEPASNTMHVAAGPAPAALGDFVALPMFDPAPAEGAEP